ncbi:MAG: hypothetical protein ACOY4I_16565 [Bacillota bacterium]
MKWILAIIPLIVSFYTVTYGVWAWRKGNRSGGAGVFILAALTVAVSFYSIFIRTGF